MNTTDYVRRFKDATEQLRADRARANHERFICVEALRQEKWTLQRIADEVGMTKQAVAKIAKSEA